MLYNKENYINKNIQLYPADTYEKYGKIINVDDLGFTIKIYKANKNAEFKVNDIIFISHSKNLTFKFIG